MDEEEASKLFTSVRYKSLSASGYYSERSKQVPTASFEALFADPNNRTFDAHGYVDVAFEGELGGGLQYRARGFYDRFEYSSSAGYDYALPGEPMDFVMYRDQTVGEWIGGEVHLTGMFLSRYTVVIGSEYRANIREDQFAFEDIDPPVYDVADTGSSDVIGAFAQVEASLRSDFRVTAGLRYDGYSDSFGSTVNPRVAAIYNPTERSAFKLLYGEAFRAPNPYERYYYNEEQRSHPTLEPETIETYEAVYEHYFGAHYRANLSAYRYRIHRLITQAEDDPGEFYYANVDAVQARGAEIELEAKFASGLTARGSYTLQRAEEESTDTELTSSPHQLGKVSLLVPLFKTGAYSSLELQYHDSSFTLGGATSRSFWLTNEA